MTEILLDSNVLLRLLAATDPRHAISNAAVTDALSRGDTIYLAPQVVMESWVVMTRPRDVNGFGWSTAVVQGALDGAMRRLPLLPENPAVFAEWWTLVGFGVNGKRAHDARLAAIMQVHGVRHIMTFNVADFASFDGIVPFVPGTQPVP